MPFDPFQFVRSLETKSPKLSHKLAMCFLGLISPFNGHLKTEMLEWTDNRVLISLKRSRGVRNHVKSIHAGAQFTLGETCAGLVIIRNFPFAGYRPLMSDVKVTYSKQARGRVVGECALSPEDIAKMHRTIEAGEVPMIEMVTNIRNDQDEIITVVTTTWQVKPWGQVRPKKD